LSGIGPNKAQKIIEYREKFGPFVSVEQLKEVSGIGQATLDKNAGKITL
jgi:competence protein ComEA